MMDKSEVSAQNVSFPIFVFLFLPLWVCVCVYIDHKLLMVYFPSTHLVLGKAVLLKN